MSEFMPYPYRRPGDAMMRFKKRKSRFTFQELELMLSEVQRKRHILVGRFNRGISKEMKHRTWAALTERINEVSECHREVIEIIKKWTDLKCDTQRRVVALRTSGATSAQIAHELSPIETMVFQILQLSSPNGSISSLGVDDTMDDEEEDIPDFAEIPHTSSHVANLRPYSFGMPMPVPMPMPMPPPFHTTIPGKAQMELPPHMMFNDSVVPPTNLHMHPSLKEGSHMPFMEPVRQPHPIGIPPFFIPPISDNSQVQEKAIQKTLNGPSAASTPTFTVPSTASLSALHLAPAQLTSQPASSPKERLSQSASMSLQERLTQSASLSLQEQQASTQLIGSLSRSLESLAESVQKMVHTQRQFSHDTLQLQRDTLYVLREFSSNTLTLLQDKMNRRL
ncbi:hypothetical protein DNTS_010875 [Danionella cerebrum]|uniref:Myb/SANT-like DNA-binding domain-containing protein n=1 Tax=Danionella cerebrum TaxID=2873325 RepID=A0A553NL56_9TELE|nr:hypothetical protein DNTS_010875 [Danionella translucida]